HVPELQKMGASLSVEGRSAVINGPTRLRGTRVSVPDIRSGAALVIAGLCAEGTTELANTFHIDRGYQEMDSKLAQLGASVQRVPGDEAVGARDLTGVIGD